MESVKCEKCGVEFKKEDDQDKVFVWEKKPMCEECLFRMGANPEDAMTWTAFVHSQEHHHPPQI